MEEGEKRSAKEEREKEEEEAEEELVPVARKKKKKKKKLGYFEAKALAAAAVAAPAPEEAAAAAPSFRSASLAEIVYLVQSGQLDPEAEAREKELAGQKEAGGGGRRKSDATASLVPEQAPEAPSLAVSCSVIPTRPHLDWASLQEEAANEEEGVTCDESSGKKSKKSSSKADAKAAGGGKKKVKKKRSRKASEPAASLPSAIVFPEFSDTPTKKSEEHERKRSAALDDEVAMEAGVEEQTASALVHAMAAMSSAPVDRSEHSDQDTEESVLIEMDGERDAEDGADEDWEAMYGISSPSASPSAAPSTSRLGRDQPKGATQATPLAEVPVACREELAGAVEQVAKWKHTATSCLSTEKAENAADVSIADGHLLAASLAEAAKKQEEEAKSKKEEEAAKRMEEQAARQAELAEAEEARKAAQEIAKKAERDRKEEAKRQRREKKEEKKKAQEAAAKLAKEKEEQQQQQQAEEQRVREAEERKEKLARERQEREARKAAEALKREDAERMERKRKEELDEKRKKEEKQRQRDALAAQLTEEEVRAERQRKAAVEEERRRKIAESRKAAEDEKSEEERRKREEAAKLRQQEERAEEEMRRLKEEENRRAAEEEQKARERQSQEKQKKQKEKKQKEKERKQRLKEEREKQLREKKRLEGIRKTERARRRAEEEEALLEQERQRKEAQRVQRKEAVTSPSVRTSAVTSGEVGEGSMAESVWVLLIILFAFYLANYDYADALVAVKEVASLKAVLSTLWPVSFLSWPLLSALGARWALTLAGILQMVLVASSAVALHHTVRSSLEGRRASWWVSPATITLFYGLGTTVLASGALLDESSLLVSFGLLAICLGISLVSHLTEKQREGSMADISAALAAGFLLSVPSFIDYRLVAVPVVFLVCLVASQRDDRRAAALFLLSYGVGGVFATFLGTLGWFEGGTVTSSEGEPFGLAASLLSPSVGLLVRSPLLLLSLLMAGQTVQSLWASLSSGSGPSRKEMIAAAFSGAVLSFLLLLGVAPQPGTAIGSGAASRVAFTLLAPCLVMLLAFAVGKLLDGPRLLLRLALALLLLSVCLQVVTTTVHYGEEQWREKPLYVFYPPGELGSGEVILRTSDKALAARLGAYLPFDSLHQDARDHSHRHRLWSLTDCLLFDMMRNWQDLRAAQRERGLQFEARLDALFAEEAKAAAIVVRSSEEAPQTTSESSSHPVAQTEQAPKLSLAGTRVLHLLYIGADEGVNVGHEAYYSTFVRLASRQAAAAGYRLVVTPLRLLPPIGITSSCKDLVDGSKMQRDFGQYDGIVVGGGTLLSEHYLCPLQLDTTLEHFPDIPLLLWGPGFDDMSLVTADKALLQEMRRNVFSSLAFGEKSRIVQFLAKLNERKQVFGGVRGGYTVQFAERILAASQSDASPALSHAVGDAGLLSGLLKATRDGVDDGTMRERVLAKYGIPSGRTYVMVNYGSPTEGQRHMYGRGGQILGTSLDMLIKDLSQEHLVVLYATATADIDHVASLREIVTTVGVKETQAMALTVVPTTSDLLTLLEGTELSVAFRFFSSALSIVAKCPLVSLAYRFKTIELMDSVGLSQFTTTTADCSYSSLQILARRAMGSREIFAAVSSAAVAHVMESFTQETDRFLSAALHFRSGGSAGGLAGAASSSSRPLSVLYLGSQGDEGTSLEAAFTFKSLGAVLAAAMEALPDLAGRPLELTSHSPSLGHLQAKDSGRGFDNMQFDISDMKMEDVLAWLESPDMEQQYPVPWHAYHLVVIGNVLFPDAVMEQYISSLHDHNERFAPVDRTGIFFWSTDCDISRMLEDVHEEGLSPELAARRQSLLQDQSDLYLSTVYQDIVPVLQGMEEKGVRGPTEQPSSGSSPSMCGMALDLRMEHLYNVTLPSEGEAALGLDGACTIAPAILSGSFHAPERRAGALTLPLFLRRRLPFDLGRSSGRLIGLHYSSIEEGSEKAGGTVFGRRRAGAIEALTSICKAIQLLSDDGYVVVLFTSASGNRVTSEKVQEDLQSMWSFVRAGAEQHQSVVSNVILLPEVLDVSYLSQLLSHFSLVISVGGDRSGAMEGAASYHLGLPLAVDVPLFHLATSWAAVEAMQETVGVPEWVLHLDLVRSGATLHAMLSRLILQRDPHVLRQEAAGAVARATQLVFARVTSALAGLL